MDPFTALTMASQVVGLGMSLFGGASAADDAKQASQIQSQIAGVQSAIMGDEGRLEDQRRKAMELQAHRQSVEILRANQRARSSAINNATNQGANLGTGLQGGLSQIEGQGLFNLAGVQQNLQIGEAMFDINKDITAKKQQIAQYQGQLAQVQGKSATDQGIASLGGAFMKAGPTIGSIGGSFFNNIGSS